MPRKNNVQSPPELEIRQTIYCHLNKSARYLILFTYRPAVDCKQLRSDFVDLFFFLSMYSVRNETAEQFKIAKKTLCVSIFKIGSI